MVYNNTISIKQLENKIESDLSKELGDRLANISTSLDDDISVKMQLIIWTKTRCYRYRKSLY